MSGGVLEWTDEMTTIKLDTHGSEPRLITITIAMSCVVGPRINDWACEGRP